jgi:CheY-like chemotaxis protein
MNILLIEDDKKVLKTASEWLSSAFADVGEPLTIFEASNGLEAVNLHNKEVDVVLIDMILMSEDKELEDVVTLIKELRIINNNAEYIAVSGYVEHKIITTCKMEGLIDGLFVKPVDFDDLAEFLVTKSKAAANG